jgi:hypothetical protein
LSVWRVRDHYYDQKKKVLLVCLVGVQSLLQPEKKIQLSVWRVRDRYYNRKKSSSRLEEMRLAMVSVPESNFFSAKNKKKVPHLFNGNSENFL